MNTLFVWSEQILFTVFHLAFTVSLSHNAAAISTAFRLFCSSLTVKLLVGTVGIFVAEQLC